MKINPVPGKLTDFYLLKQLNKKQLTALVHDLISFIFLVIVLCEIGVLAQLGLILDWGH